MRKFYLLLSLLVIFLPAFLFAFTQVDTAKSYIDTKYGFSLSVPKNWVNFEKEYTALKGGTVKSVYITQQTDISSRRIKYFSLQIGSPESIFGLSHTVVQKVTKEQMLDFYISLSSDTIIVYSVSKTYTKSMKDKKVYVIEGSYMEPGPYKVITSDYFVFNGDKVFHWSTGYFSDFSQYAPTLQALSDSLVIQ